MGMDILNDLATSPMVTTLLGAVVGYWAAQRISRQNRTAALEAAKKEQILKTAQYLLDTGAADRVEDIGGIVLFPNPGRKVPGSLHGHRDITIIMVDVTGEGIPRASHAIFDYSTGKRDIGQDIEEALVDVLATFQLPEEDKVQLRNAEQNAPGGFIWVYNKLKGCMLIIGVLQRKDGCMNSSGSQAISSSGRRNSNMSESEAREIKEMPVERENKIKYPPIEHRLRGSDRYRWPDWLRRKPKSD